eukprot:scaffold5929_cov52-Prasinocladus_malaysianus.AAC.1
MVSALNITTGMASAPKRDCLSLELLIAACNCSFLRLAMYREQSQAWRSLCASSLWTSDAGWC